METIKKHWITFLGIGFLFSAFLYFLKLAIDNDWINPVTRVSLGFVLGLSGVFFGVAKIEETLPPTPQETLRLNFVKYPYSKSTNILVIIIKISIN